MSELYVSSWGNWRNITREYQHEPVSDLVIAWSYGIAHPVSADYVRWQERTKRISQLCDDAERDNRAMLDEADAQRGN